MNRLVLGFMAAVLLPLVARAQQDSHHPGQQPAQPTAQTAAKPETNPVSNAVRKIMERRSKITVGAAAAMHADKYTFRPTPEQMAFGHLVVHTLDANSFLCGSIAGTAAPTGE